jgi:hypothetical protein
VNRRGHTPALVALASIITAGLGSGMVVGCGKKSSAPEGLPPEVSGLAAVPANAEVIVAANVPRLAGSQVVERAIDQLLLRDANLAARWKKFGDICKIDLPKQIGHVMIALGPAPHEAVGTGPVLTVATGTLVEAELQKCVQAMVGQGGGTLTAKSVEDRTLYQVKDRNQTMFFAFGRPDTVVLGTSEAYVVEALGRGKKAPDNEDLAKLLRQVDQRAPIWVAGRVSERIRAGLGNLTNGKVIGPQAVVATLDPSSGVTIEIGAVMANADEAKQLESFANKQLAVLGMAAQTKELGKVVNKLTISSSGTVVRFKAALSIDDINRLFCVLDGAGNCGQDATPQQGSDTK